jgi:hypothetical protein
MRHKHSKQQQQTVDELLLVTHENCQHEYNVCKSVLLLQEVEPVGCPVCEPDFPFREYNMTRMSISFDGKKFEQLLVCPSCHDSICPNKTEHVH